MSIEKKKGCFTLPGEAGYEKLTLEMAEKWGADVPPTTGIRSI